MSDFKGRHFGGEIVLWADRAKLGYSLSRTALSVRPESLSAPSASGRAL